MLANETLEKRRDALQHALSRSQKATQHSVLSEALIAVEKALATMQPSRPLHSRSTQPEEPSHELSP